MFWSLIFAFGLSSTLQLTADGGQAHSETSAWILDSEASSLILIAVPSGERLTELAIDGAPEFLLQSPDGSRLIVLDKGPGEEAEDRGYQAKGPSIATIIDPARWVIVARVELGAGVDEYNHYFSPDGPRLTLLCPGYEHKKATKALPRELVNIDLIAGVEMGRTTLEHGTVPIGTDGQTLTLMRGLQSSSVRLFGQGRLSIVKLSGPVISAVVATGGWFDLATDGAFVYLLHKGWPNRNPRFHRNGSVHAYSVERRALETAFDVGNDPKGLFRDEQSGQLFILSGAPPGEPDEAAGRLYVVHSARLAAMFEVAANPRIVARAGEAIFVVGEAAVTVVDPVALHVIATIPLRNNERDLVDDEDVPTELRLTADRQRAFILYGLHNRVVVLDLDANVAVGSTTTGPTNKKLLTGLGSALLLAGLYPGWPGDVLTATGEGIGIWKRHLYSGEATTPSMLAVQPDGHVAYAVNSQGSKVSVIDATTAERVAQIGARGHDLKLLPGGHVLAVLSRSTIHLIDIAANAKLAELAVPELRAFEPTPDGLYVVALGRGAVLCLESATGKVIAELKDFREPVALAFSETQ